MENGNNKYLKCIKNFFSIKCLKSFIFCSAFVILGEIFSIIYCIKDNNINIGQNNNKEQKIDKANNVDKVILYCEHENGNTNNITNEGDKSSKNIDKISNNRNQNKKDDNNKEQF